MMKIEVRLFATLAGYLPTAPGRGPGILEVPDGSTVGVVVSSLGISEEMPAVTLVNGRDAAPEQVLKDGDVLALFPPLAGGSS
jgi:molybdopterin converting factor small subunit